MTDIPQPTLATSSVLTCLEQKFVTGANSTGVTPTNSTLTAGERDFVLYFDTETGIYRYKNPGPTETAASEDEATDGGLFTNPYDKPILIDQILGNLSSAVAWKVILKTDSSTVDLDGATTQMIALKPEYIMFPGEAVQVTWPTVTGTPWVRVYLRIDPNCS